MWHLLLPWNPRHNRETICGNSITKSPQPFTKNKLWQTTLWNNLQDWARNNSHSPRWNLQRSYRIKDRILRKALDDPIEIYLWIQQRNFCEITPKNQSVPNIGTADRDALKPRRIARSNQRSIGHIFRYCYQHWINFRTLSKDVISSSSYALADTIKAGGTAIEDVEEGGADIFNSIFGVIPGVLGMASLLIVLCIARYFIYKWYVTSCFKSAPTFNPN